MSKIFCFVTYSPPFYRLFHNISQLIHILELEYFSRGGENLITPLIFSCDSIE